MARRPDDDNDLPPLAAGAVRALIASGLTSLAKLSMEQASDVRALRGMGPKAMAALEHAMTAERMSFAKPR